MQDEEVLEPELLDEEDVKAMALSRSQGQGLAVQEGLASLAYIETGMQILERNLGLQKQLRKGLLEITEPEEWIRSRTAEGLITAVPTKSGLRKIARAIGFEYQPVPGCTLEPQQVFRETEGGRVEGYSLEILVRARAYGGAWEQVGIVRWADEKFTGRQVDAKGELVTRGGVRALSSDLKNAARSGAVSKGIHELTGLGKVFDSQLLEAFGAKGLERCQRGHGFGSSADRGAQRVAEGGVAEGAKALWDDILRLVSGDEVAAHAVLKEITSYPAGTNKSTGKAWQAFAGVDSWERITRAQSLDQARRKLAQHEVFGDQAREPGED